MARSRAAAMALVLVTLLLTGWGTRPLAVPAWEKVRAGEPALNAADLEGTLGHGLTLGLLGGFRAVMADFLWLNTNVHWEKRDFPATQKMISAVTTVDPRPLYFWINGARMIAYDMPHWRLEEVSGPGPAPAAVKRRIDEEQAQAALALLERALAVHPRNPLLLIEIANIHHRRRNDLETAAEYFRLAASEPGAPYYAARIYAELLRHLGRPREAYDWLCALYVTLPLDDPRAQAPFVLGRIRELEVQLRIGEADRFVPSTP